MLESLTACEQSAVTEICNALILKGKSFENAFVTATNTVRQMHDARPSDFIMELGVGDDVPKLFPLFLNDTIETIIDRYFKIYPIEAKASLEQVKDLSQDHGWTDLRTMKLSSSMPAILFHALRRQFPEDFVNKHEIDKILRKIAVIAPKFFTSGGR